MNSLTVFLAIPTVMYALFLAKKEARLAIMAEEDREYERYIAELQEIDADMMIAQEQAEFKTLSDEGTLFNLMKTVKLCHRRIERMEQYTEYLCNVERRLNSPLLGILVF